jgi:hypothetical protein
MPVSPELVLVCPELRASAIAALPELGQDEWRGPRNPVIVEHVVSAVFQNDSATPNRPGASLPVAVLWYAAGSAAKFAFEAAVVVAVLVGLLAVTAVLQP